MSCHSYADRGAHFRAQAAAARAAGDRGDAHRLDRLARRCDTAHRRQPVTLDVVVEVAAAIENQLGRALTINESSALKTAYQVARAGAGTIAALLAELSLCGWTVDAWQDTDTATATDTGRAA